MLLRSRYNDVHTIVTRTADDNVFFLATDGMYVRLIGEPDNLEAIDFEGGPMLSIGDTVMETKTIAKIETTKYGYLITVDHNTKE